MNRFGRMFQYLVRGYQFFNIIYGTTYVCSGSHYAKGKKGVQGKFLCYECKSFVIPWQAMKVRTTRKS